MRTITAKMKPVGEKPRLLTPAEMMATAPLTATTDLRTVVRHKFWQVGLVLRGAAKRALDLLVAGAAVLALSPLLALTALAIRLESPGPVLFFQTRVGLRGRHFAMIKFRSMRIGAEAEKAALAADNESGDGVIFKMRRDPRITRVGAFIRRFSIDELPQILNVLRGDMTIVGPRPPVPSEVAQYTNSERKRLQGKPGLTCLWQIGGRSDLAFQQQVELDLEYLATQDLSQDIKIIAKTLPAVLSGRGAY